MNYSTRLRYVSSPSPEGLEAFINSLPFKVEVKSIAFNGKNWFCWFVLPDTITHEMLNELASAHGRNINSANLEDI